MAKVKTPKATTGYGYTGLWHNGQAGWYMPIHVSGDLDRKFPSDPITPDSHPHLAGQRLYLCKITITPVADKLGRPITKIVDE